jgi:hypothetical protein
MFNKSCLRLAVSVLIAVPVVVQAEVEVTAVLKNETAAFIKDGMRTGEATSATDTSGEGTGLMKFENSARIFFNGDIGEESSWHGELNFIYDAEATPSDYKGHRVDSQHDWFRELYVDTNAAGWDFRLGKQQVVWGTADGIKLLDIINPTDYREFSQNAMENSRIPVWMANAERNIGENSNIQFIASEVESHRIPGMEDGSSDQGHPFIMKGVDSITGRVNGFFNIAPALAGVADSFDDGAQAGAFDSDDDGAGDLITQGLTGFSGLTVDGFASNTQQLNADGSIRAGGSAGASSSAGINILNNLAQNGTPASGTNQASNANNNVTNLVDTAYVVGASANSTFEYMPNATFATFNTFARNANHDATVTRWVNDNPDDFDTNLGFRFKANADSGLNYSVNYLYHYDPNPVVDVTWHDAATGEQLTTVLATSGDFDGNTAPDFADPTGAAGGTTISRDQVPNTLAINGFGQVTNSTSVLLRNSAGQYYGSIAPNPTLALSNNGTELRFTKSLKRVHSLGGSFDYALDAGNTPIVLRGEFVYDKDSSQVVVNKKLLGIGDLEGGLTSRDADYFKYVLGVDVTVLTDLLVSGQFIQFRNLDYIDESAACNTQSAAQGSTSNSTDCSKYTGDMATLHLSNGMQRAEKNKDFYSLFLSKPFGESDLGRVNNILIYEEGGGYWNRLDAEYSLSDQLVVTGELNMYWGDENTTFGQFENSSSIQVGLKYLIE